MSATYCQLKRHWLNVSSYLSIRQEALQYSDTLRREVFRFRLGMRITHVVEVMASDL